MQPLDKGYCLVLSGGGTKGIYHLGVWKALRELGIEIRGFVGTSIGAIVAGLLAQNLDRDYDSFSESIDLESVIAIPDTLIEDGKLSVSVDAIAEARSLFRSIVVNRGLDTSPLRALIESWIDEDRIRASGKDLGVVTIHLGDFKPRELFLEQMEPGTVLDYLMASAAFPGFARPVIKGKKYLDGGMLDNIPYAMARQRGYRRIIISDISGIGLNRKPEIEGSMTVYIKNSIAMGSAFDFDRTFMREYRQLGYLDTLRCFGALEGHSYFLEPGSFGEDSIRRAALLPLPALPRPMLHERNRLLAFLECAAGMLELPRIRRYRYIELEEAILAAQAAEEDRISELISDTPDSLASQLSRLKESVGSLAFKGSAYYNYRLSEELLPGTAGDLVRKALCRHFECLPAGLSWLGIMHSQASRRSIPGV